MRTANKWKSYPVESDLQTLAVLELSDTESKTSVLIFKERKNGFNIWMQNNRGNKNKDLKKYKMELLALKDNNYCRIKF